MSDREEVDSDSGAPEEFTVQQGIQKDEEIRKVQKENKARVVREGKQRRRKWAEKLTPRPSRRDGSAKKKIKTEGMLPDDIVQHVAAIEKAVNKKKVFLSDSEDEKAEEKNASRKKRTKDSRLDIAMLNDRPAHCPQSSLDFLKKRKMQVARSSAVLNNSNQALRLLCSSGLLKKDWR
ncbi:uncharacterized protein LOC111367945 [Olea europaea var. sylvestris]|uniref:Uncharacterized protein n=1 Tax=Olea europaea subsp. europaea TaxID=158383 RepID=A0A8S0QXD5_OLEEU|nr:uncharacterized protein LOC111367945 [Olea europaea var. sylvestris]CAA2970919.1 Hypothetical predicted protein [Olea europaea subsp. europaea]